MQKFNPGKSTAKAKHTIGGSFPTPLFDTKFHPGFKHFTLILNFSQNHVLYISVL